MMGRLRRQSRMVTNICVAAAVNASQMMICEFRGVLLPEAHGLTSPRARRRP